MNDFYEYDEIKKYIDVCEVVSFDIFDTLICRIVDCPEDIFDLVGAVYSIEGFREKRIKYQNIASDKVKKNLGVPHANIDQIYQQLAESETKETIDWDKVKNTEIQMEIDSVFPNSEIMQIYQYAREKNKRIIAVSDMYLKHEQIQKMLEKCSYNYFDNIYISSETHTTKYEGTIYSYVEKEENINGAKIFHIGDNLQSDVKNAKKAGWNALLYNKRSVKGEIFGDKETSLMRGVEKLLVKDDSNFWYNLGVYVGGPLYLGLFLWMKKKLENTSYDKIFFMSRDGYNLYKLFSKYSEKNIEYMYVSRRSLLLAGIYKLDEETLNLLPPFTLGQTVREVLEYIGMINVCSDNIHMVGIESLDQKITNADTVKRVKQLYVINEQRFLEKCKKERIETKRYFEKIGFLNVDSVVFDCGWNGSSQYLLDRFLNLIDYRGKNKFFYTGILETEKSKKQLREKEYCAYLFDQKRNKEIQEAFKHAVVLGELFFGAPEGSVIDYQNAKPNLEQFHEDKVVKSAIFSGIQDFIENSIFFVEKYGMEIDPEEAVSGLRRLIYSPTEKEAIEIGNLENVDGFVVQQGQKKYVAKLDKKTYDQNPETEIYWLEGLLKRPDIDDELKQELKKKYKMREVVEKNAVAKKITRIYSAIKKYGVITSVFLYKSNKKKCIDLYNEWIEENENENIKYEMKYMPLFSVVVPVYNVKEQQLVECIESIKNQTYKNWELCLVDDCSTWSIVKKVLKRYENEENIKILYRKENGHISKATNDGIRLSTGEFIIFCDCDDVIASNALMEFANELNINPDLDFIYSDEDKLSENGEKRHSPFFKPDWSPDTFMSLMYTNHLAMYRKELVLKTGGLRSEFNGAQDYDFTLRFMELTSNDRVGHIPKVLYHWRERAESIASTIESKPYALKAVEQAKIEALQRRNIQGDVEFVKDMYQYRIVYRNDRQPLVSIIIPSKDNTKILFQCIDSILELTDYSNYEIILMDNGSTEENRNIINKYIIEKPVKYYYKKQKFNFSQMCNDGAKNANGDYLLFLNDDTKILEGNWLSILVGHASLNYIGAVGAKLLYPDSCIIQHVGVQNLPIGPSHTLMGQSDEYIYYFGRNRMEYNYLAVTGACLLINSEKFWQVGGFNTELSVAYNDIDLCFKLYEKGYYNVVRNDVVLYHYESISRGSDDADIEKRKRQMAEKEILYRNHINLMGKDPFYNINLTYEKNNYEIRVREENKNKIKKVKKCVNKRGKTISIIDEAYVSNSKGRISGWHFDNITTISNLQHVYIMLKNESDIYSIPTQKIFRPDVAAALNNKGFLTGFTCEFDIGELPKTSYMIGVAEKRFGKIKCIWTDKKLMI